jgi:teichuronic acid biosynthesis glycosyltransferase TuaC
MGRDHKLRVLAVTNMYPAPDAPQSGRFIQQQIVALERLGLHVEVLFINRRKNGMRAYAGLPSLLRKTIARFKPDLVHVMYGGIMSRLVSYLVRDRPVVVTFHGSDLLGQPFERPLRRFLSACGVIASRQAARRCDGVVAVAEHLLKRIPENIPRSKIRVIPCGVDLNLFQPMDRAFCCDRLGWPQDTFHILFQNSGDPVKRPELANAAVQRLKEFGVNAELHQLRGVAYDQVPIWLNASDILLVTSHHEGSPTIVKEALACNLPVVSTPVGDVKERLAVVQPSAIVPSDVEAIARALMQIANEKKRSNGREHVMDLGQDQVVQRVLGVYRAVVEKALATA